MEPVPLSVFELDCPAPAAGWAAELTARGVDLVVDDVGRVALPRSVARDLLAEHREEEARKDQLRREVERRAIEADRAFRAQLPPGVPVAAIPEGLSVAQLWCASDPLGEGSERRVGVLEHALQHRDGAIVYHPIGGES